MAVPPFQTLNSMVLLYHNHKWMSIFGQSLEQEGSLCIRKERTGLLYEQAQLFPAAVPSGAGDKIPETGP